MKIAHPRFDRQLLNRMVEAVELVRERLIRATGALEAANVPYAVVGGNAVAAWVSQVNRRAVRNTADVDILLRREDLPMAAEAMKKVGFIFRHAAGIDFFLDGPDGEFADAVHVVKAGEKVRNEYVAPAPTLDEAVAGEEFRVLALEALVRMKLTSFRDKDRTHLRDFISVGLLDSTWSSRFQPELAERLQQLLDTPEG